MEEDLNSEDEDRQNEDEDRQNEDEDRQNEYEHRQNEDENTPPDDEPQSSDPISSNESDDYSDSDSESNELSLEKYDEEQKKKEEIKKRHQEVIKRFNSEQDAGNPADLTSNVHFEQSTVYDHLGRRFVPQYKYTERGTNSEQDEPIPIKAPAELVLVIAKESALMGPDKFADLENDIDQKKILRSGDYWNGVWKEEVNPVKSNRVLRNAAPPNPTLSSITAKIKPKTELYNIVSQMKRMSPRLLYIINKKST